MTFIENFYIIIGIGALTWFIIFCVYGMIINYEEKREKNKNK